MTETATDQAPTRSKLARRWLVRMVGITIVLLGFGAWGYIDAVTVYPNRGKLFAESQQWDYLRTAERSGRIFEAAIPDPRAALDDLQARDQASLTELELARLLWLESVAIPGVGLLTPEHTDMEDPRAELTRLDEKFQTTKIPKPLSSYDILVQWLICFVCWAIALWLIVLMLRVKARVYRWDPNAETLTIPGGNTISAADLDPEDPADLSRWRKFIIVLRPRGGTQLPGPLRFDVFRHEPLEEWLRVLVKRANPEIEFPDEREARERAEAEAEAAKAQEPGDSASESEDASQSPEDARTP